MSDKLVTVNANWSAETDFFELNPQVRLIPAFAKASSAEMWAAFFMNDPDEYHNKLYRLPPEERWEAITEYFGKLDRTKVDALGEHYRLHMLTSVQRTYKEIKDTLAQRAEFLKNTPYSIENVATLDNAHVKTIKIYEQYDQIEEKFIRDKETARVKGGRKLSKAERREI